MTDRPTPDPSPADHDLELASAHLDGEATPDEAARIDADPALRALVDDLRRLAGEVDPGPAPGGLADAHVAAALTAFDEERGVVDAAPVADLAAARSAREERRWYERIPLGAVAAAALLVALVGGWSLLAVDRDDEQTAAVGAPTESADLDEAAGAGETAPDLPASDTAGSGGGGGGVGGGDGGALLDNLSGRPAFPDDEALAAHLSELARAQRFDADAGDNRGSEEAVNPSAAEAAPCDLLAVADAGRGTILLEIPAVVAGQPVVAFVIDTGGDDRDLLVIVDESTCRVSDERRLGG